MRDDSGPVAQTASSPGILFARNNNPAVFPDVIPLLRPQLPTVNAILPYLERIDKTRIYSNFGPLSREFEDRLRDTLKIQSGGVLAAGSGTSALMGAILVCARLDDSRRRLAFMPSFTFAATAVAAERCGLQPYFLDVDPVTWSLDPSAIKAHPRLGEAAIVIPVAPFGRPPRQDQWLEFQTNTEVPVVFDNAAAFSVISDNARDFIGQIPAIFSFHATKSFGIGEGGAAITTDPRRIADITAALNFGFFGSRESRSPSLNGKLSEYIAAVGLAAIDGWPAKAAAIRETSLRYRLAFERRDISTSLFTYPDIDGSYALFRCKSMSERKKLERRFQQTGIESRMWYGGGVQAHSHFSHLPGDPLPITHSIASTLVGIPMLPDISNDAIERIATVCATLSHRTIVSAVQPKVIANKICKGELRKRRENLVV